MSDTFQTGKTFVTGEQVTATDLNNSVNQAVPKVPLTDDQSITVVNNKLVVKDGSATNGVPLAKMQHIAARSVICNTGSSTAAPTALAIANNQVLKGSASGLEVGTIDNDNLTNNGISIDADSGTTHEIDLGETLTVTGGEGMDTTIANNTLTVAGEDASSSNKGIAKFNTDNFSVSSGDVIIKNGGVNNDELAGSIANSKLSNSSLTVTAGTGLSGGGSIALGGSATLNVGSLTNSELSGSAGISNANLANSAVTVTAGTGLNGGGSVALGASATINLDSAIPNNSTTNTQSVSDNSTKLATTAFVTNAVKNVAFAVYKSSGSTNTDGTRYISTNISEVVDPYNIATQSGGLFTFHEAGTYLVELVGKFVDNDTTSYDEYNLMFVNDLSSTSNLQDQGANFFANSFVSFSMSIVRTISNASTDKLAVYAQPISSAARDQWDAQDCVFKITQLS
jgi:hypothetical protein